jgi:hypothetical protein
MTGRTLLAAGLMLAASSLALPQPARADAGTAANSGKCGRLGFGFQLDLLPTVLSAASGKLGYAPQVWLGIGHVRMRLVGAHMHLPDAFAFAPGWKRPSLSVLVVVFDYTFGDHFDGFWIGPGFEIWQRSIERDDTPGTARFSSLVATIGAGYTIRVGEHFFVDPWVAVHAVMNPYPVQLGEHRYEPFPLLAEASVKVGWSTDL